MENKRNLNNALELTGLKILLIRKESNRSANRIFEKKSWAHWCLELWISDKVWYGAWNVVTPSISLFPMRLDFYSNAWSSVWFLLNHFVQRTIYLHRFRYVFRFTFQSFFIFFWDSNCIISILCLICHFVAANIGFWNLIFSIERFHFF